MGWLHCHFMTGNLQPDDRLGDFTADRRVLTLTGMAALIGVISAFVALALLRLIGFFTHLFYYHAIDSRLVSPADNRLGVWALLVPIVGGLIVGLMARYGSERIRGHGIPEALEAILIGQSRMSARVAVLKPLSSAISIGTGGPFGAEGPIIMTGGALGSLFGQAFHLSPAERKTLLVAGAAGGMAAVFGTPLAATLLAVELLLFEWKPRSFIPVACAAAVAGALRVPLLGAGPLFPVPPHAALTADGLIIALALGIAAGFGSGLLTWLVYACEDLFRKVPVHWMWWPLLGGTVIGLGGLLYPRALGVGYDTIHDLLTGQLVGVALLGFVVTKAVIWAVALGSGTSGGVLALLLMKRSILTEKVARRGYHVTREYIANPLHLLRVQDVMEPPVLQVGERPPAVSYPDELLDHALTKLLEHEVDLLPVVNRSEPEQVVGYVARDGILAAWVQFARDEGRREPGWLAAQFRKVRDRPAS